jgi:hypothetical protein
MALTASIPDHLAIQYSLYDPFQSRQSAARSNTKIPTVFSCFSRSSLTACKVKNIEMFTYQPLVDLQDLPQLLQVVDQVPRGVVHQGGVRDALPRPPLVHEDDPVEVWVEEAAVVGRGAGARASVEEDDRLRTSQL